MRWGNNGTEGGRSSPAAEWLREAEVVCDAHYLGDRGRSPSRVAMDGRAVVPDRRVDAGSEGRMPLKP